MIDRDKTYSVDELVELVREYGSSDNAAERDDAMYLIYKMFMYKWKPYKEPIDEFISKITQDVPNLHITVCLCVLMATFLIRKMLDRRPAFYDAVEKKVNQTYESEEERNQILRNLK